MLDYVYGHDEVVAQFVAQLIPHCRRGWKKEETRAIGVINEQGHLIAGLVYFNHDPEAGTIEIAGASIDPHWLTRGTIARMYQYPFLQCGCQMIYQKTPAENMRLLRQLAVYGYKFVKQERMFGRDRDGVICSLTYEAWAGNRFNKRFGHHLVDAELEEEAA
jgi:RimJ/RimL family protein N-acetyltransferase